MPAKFQRPGNIRLFLRTLPGLYIAILLLLISGCASPGIITGWKGDPVYSIDHFRILVVGIFDEKDSLLRREVEDAASLALGSRGYQAIKAIDHFGEKGLAGTVEEETYLKLCNAGIDAVMTFALVPSSIGTAELPASSQGLPDAFYFQRLWNYRNLPNAKIPQDSTFFLESIFFDLMSLQALSVMYTRPFEENLSTPRSIEFPRKTIDRMVKEKILKKRVTVLKGF